MVNNVCGMLPFSSTFQYMPCAGAGCSNFDSIDIDYSMYPLGCGGGSVFSEYGNMPFMGGMSGAGANQSDMKSYFENMKEYQKMYNDLNIEQQKMQRNADLQLNGSMQSIEENAANLKDKIQHNEQDQILDSYNKYIESVKRAYGDGSEEDINSRAMMLYKQMNGGKSLVQDLRDNGHSPMLQGIIQSLTFGVFNQASAEDNIAAITGQAVNEGSKVEQNVGRIIGAGIWGTTAFAAAKNVGSLTKYGGQFVKMLGKKAALIGVAVTAIAAGLAYITGKVTT